MPGAHRAENHRATTRKPAFNRIHTCILAAAAVGFLMLTPGRAAAYTASTIQDLGNFYDTYLTIPNSTNTINGKIIDWFDNGDGTMTIMFGAGYLGGKQFWSRNDKNGVVKALASSLGISPDEILISGKDSSGAAQATTSTVFTDLIVPKPTTAVQAKKAEAQRRPGMPRAVAAAARYSYLDTNSDNGYLAGLNLGLAWDFDDISVGILLPYDYTDIDNLLSAQRLGIVLFGQYGMRFTDNLSGRYTVYTDYSTTSIDYDGGGSNDISTHGGGVGASLTWKAAGLVNTFGMSVQEHRDNSAGDRTFDTIKTGLSVAMPIGATQVVAVTAGWTNDFSDYDAPYEDDNLYEAGLTYRNDLSETWCLNIGLNHKFDYNDLSATEVYLGSAMSF